MVHSGYEASAVNDTFGSWRGFLGTVKATFSSKYKDPEAAEMLEDEVRPVHHCESAGADQQLAISSWQLVKARCIGSSTVET